MLDTFAYYAWINSIGNNHKSRNLFRRQNIWNTTISISKTHSALDELICFFMIRKESFSVNGEHCRPFNEWAFSALRPAGKMPSWSVVCSVREERNKSFAMHAQRGEQNLNHHRSRDDRRLDCCVRWRDAVPSLRNESRMIIHSVGLRRCSPYRFVSVGNRLKIVTKSTLKLCHESVI